MTDELVLVTSGNHTFLGTLPQVPLILTPPLVLLDAVSVQAGHVRTEAGVGLQIMAVPYGCVEGTIPKIQLSQIASWVKVSDLLDADQRAVERLRDQVAQADLAKRAAQAGIVSPNSMPSPGEMSQILTDSRGT